MKREKREGKKKEIVARIFLPPSLPLPFLRPSNRVETARHNVRGFIPIGQCKYARLWASFRGSIRSSTMRFALNSAPISAPMIPLAVPPRSDPTISQRFSPIINSLTELSWKSPWWDAREMPAIDDRPFRCPLVEREIDNGDSRIVTVVW